MELRVRTRLIKPSGCARCWGPVRIGRAVTTMNHSGIRGCQRRRIDTGGLALHQARVRQALQHPREDRFMRLNVDEGDACGRLSNGPAVRLTCPVNRYTGNATEAPVISSSIPVFLSQSTHGASCEPRALLGHTVDTRASH